MNGDEATEAGTHSRRLRDERLAADRELAFYRYGVVLFLLAGTFTFAIIAPSLGWGRVLIVLLQGGAALVALSRARASRRLFAVGVAAAAVTVVAAVVVALGSPTQGGLADLASAGLLALVPVAIVREFRRDLTVTVRSVMAALCVYVVLGMFFANVAAAVGAIGGSPYFAGRSSADLSDYLYFSFITLATVGYGDLVPALSLGRALAVLEALMGQLYLVTVVALVIGNIGRPATGVPPDRRG